MRRFVLIALVMSGCATQRDPERGGESEPPSRSSAALTSETAAVAIERDGQLLVGGATIDVVIETERLDVSRKQIEAWIRESAQRIADYYGEFPVPSLTITVRGGGFGGVGFGQHWDGRYIRVGVGSGASERSFERDWVMVHEMLHAAFPDLARRHKWMQEGLSTYLQRIVDAQAGHMSDQRVWASFTRGMEYGRPKLGDRGLDKTRTWGRLYWGGALFWMVADIRIRQATGNRKSLREALTGIVAAGGNGRQDWATARVVEVGDRATGTHVLRDLYTYMAEGPGDIDLAALWKRLGVARDRGGRITFDDGAELAAIRRAMTRPSG